MWGFVGAVLIIGLGVVYWKVTIAIALIILAVKAIPVAWRELQSDRTVERHRLRGLITRADHQNLLVSSGDPRGVYGAYPPAV